MAARNTRSLQNSLLGLPTELRLNIFRCLWRSLVVKISRGPERRGNKWSNEDLDGTEISSSCHISPLPGTPRDVAAMKLACRQFCFEIDDSWHSEVTYHFPSTVSFIDVLSQWSQKEVCKLRYVHVIDTPLPLYAFKNRDFSITHNFSQALPMFPGLQLDLLTVENIWLYPNGQPLATWALAATNGTIKRLLMTRGWKRLEYLSGVLGLTPTQMAQLEKVVDNYRNEETEPDFQYGLGRVRPLLYARENLLDGSEDPEDLMTAIELCEEWYNSEETDERPPCHANDYPSEIAEKHVAMWAERGAGADYIQDGSALSSTLESLNANIGWADLRMTDDYLVGDALDDPTVYM